MAGAVDVTVTTPGGTSATSAADRFTYVAPPVPTVTGLSQSYGSSLGSDMVVIVGNGFTAATRVAFGTTTAFPAFLSDSAISVRVPAGMAGTVDVTVTTPGGTSATSAADRFTYVVPPVPTVTGLNQSSGLSLGGDTLVILGSGFTGATQVAFGTTTTFPTVLSDSAISVRVPAHAAGAVDLTVATPGGTSATSAADRFTYVAPPVPTVTGLNQSSGSSLGAYTVVVLGSGFTGATRVAFGTTTASPAVLSDSALSVQVPARMAGTVDVTVTTPGGTSATSAADHFTYVAPPVPSVTGLNQSSGSSLGGYTVVILGSGFTAASQVAFGTTTARPIVLSDSALSVTVPAGVAGVVDVTVTTPGGTSSTSAADRFTYVVPPVPTVTGVGLNAGAGAGGYMVTIIGTDFIGVSAVSFGGTPATFVVRSVNTILATVPRGTAGTVDVRVTAAGGTSAVTVADRFTYLAPTVTGVGPVSGLVGGGYSVTLIGSGFTGATAVSFGGTPATSFTVNSDATITAVAPAGTAGVVDITVTTPGGVSATSAADQFTYVTQQGMDGPVPVVTGVGAATGGGAGGYTVTILGTGFLGATAVAFGSTPATNFTVVSSNVITARVPAQAAGTVDVTVTGPGGTSVTSAADQFTYVGPTVTGLGLTTGSTLGGESVTIIGSGFTGATTVTFGGIPASFIVNSDGMITATAPIHLTVTVYPMASETVYRNPDGTGAETTSYSYTWYDISNAMQSQTVTHAVVSAAQNGPGTPDVETTVYDIYGRVIWTKDGGGFIKYTEYDPATGAVDKMITDVDTTRTTDFQNLPAGWVTPPGGGLHLETQIGVDALGREIQRVDPNGDITYTVYDDPDHEVRVYPGWNAATGMPTGPTQITREDRAHSPSYVEILTTSDPPNVDGNGLPDGTEPISQVQSLRRFFTSPGGQVIETDAYVSLRAPN
jgi:hypothetical protein